uniref:Uncharacterized protein n=1 Tax=Ditylenchus dipsaci TaxID=166011 RepID=A0A915DID8_9BILA
MIIAICVSAVPPTEIRRQKHLDVFFVTAPGQYLLFTAWITDIKIIQKKFVPHRYRRGSHGLVATEGEELKMLEGNGVGGHPYRFITQDSIDPALRALKNIEENLSRQCVI